MDKVVKILIVEDSADDLDLLQRELQRAALKFISHVVKARHEFSQALQEFKPDVILSDHSLPQFNSIEAIQLCKEYQSSHNVIIPFILVTGSVSEEFAVQCIKAGADDYILKDRLKRLPASIKNALEKVRLENASRNSMAQVLSQSSLMKEAEHLANFGSWQVDLATGKHQWSDEAFRIFGFKPGEIDPDYEKFFQHVHPEDKERLKGIIQQAIDGLPFQECEFRIMDKNQKIKHLHSRILVKRNNSRRASHLLGFTLDITKQKRQTEALEMQNRKLMEIAWVQSHEVRAPLARLMGLTELLKRYPTESVHLDDCLNRILQSAEQLDGIVREIVRKTEEIV